MPAPAPPLPPLIVAFTQGDLLALFDRLLPEDYVGDLKDPGPGYELLQAFAAIAVRASQAAANTDKQMVILTATGGALAAGFEVFSRQDPPGALRVTLRAGTEVTTSRGDRRFTTTVDQLFDVPDGTVKTVTAPIVAQAYGYEYNLPGQVTAADGEVLPGEIDTIRRLLAFTSDGQPVIDDNTSCQQVDPTTGGQPAGLDELGGDRGILRRPGESDLSYRIRVRALPDNLTPGAIRRALTSYFTPYLGDTADFIESFEMRLQTVWNAPTHAIPGADSQYDEAASNTFVWYTADPASPGYVGNFPASPFGNRWLSLATVVACFIVVVPVLGCFHDTGFAWNDTAVGPVETSPDTGGDRAIGAWLGKDVPLAAAQLDAVGFRQGCWNGSDPSKDSVYKGLFDLLQALKVAGVLVDVELDGP